MTVVCGCAGHHSVGGGFYDQNRFQQDAIALGSVPTCSRVAARHHLKVTSRVAAALCCVQNGIILCDASYRITSHPLSLLHHIQACPRSLRDLEQHVMDHDWKDAAGEELSPGGMEKIPGNVSAQTSVEIKGGEHLSVQSTADDTYSHELHATGIKLGEDQKELVHRGQEQHMVSSAALAEETQCSGAMLTEHFSELKFCEFVGPWIQRQSVRMQKLKDGDVVSHSNQGIRPSIGVGYLQTKNYDAKIQAKEDDARQGGQDRDSREVAKHRLTADQGLAKSSDSDCSSSFGLVDDLSLGIKGRHWYTLHNLSRKRVRVYKQPRKGFLKEDCLVEKISTVRLPAYRTNFTSRFNEFVLYLQNMGVDCGKALGETSTIGTFDIQRLRKLVSALESHGLEWMDLGRLFNLCPRILQLCPDKDIKLVTSFLFDQAGLLPKDFRKVIRRCPRLLVYDVAGQLQPTLKFLQTLGFSKMGQVISNNPTLLSLNVDMKLVPKLRYLGSLGFSCREATSMVVRFPAIFNYDVNENLEPKYKYLVNEMGGSNKDLLAFPQYFGYSLDRRIIPRYRRIAKLNVPLSVQAMLTLSDVEFKVQFACPSDEKNGLLDVQG